MTRREPTTAFSAPDTLAVRISSDKTVRGPDLPEDQRQRPGDPEGAEHCSGTDTRMRRCTAVSFGNTTGYAGRTLLQSSRRKSHIVRPLSGTVSSVVAVLRRSRPTPPRSAADTIDVGRRRNRFRARTDLPLRSRQRVPCHPCRTGRIDRAKRWRYASDRCSRSSRSAAPA